MAAFKTAVGAPRGDVASLTKLGDAQTPGDVHKIGTGGKHRTPVTLHARLVMAISLTALAAVLLFADSVAFGNLAGGRLVDVIDVSFWKSYAAEFTLVLSAAVLLMTRPMNSAKSARSRRFSGKDAARKVQFKCHGDVSSHNRSGSGRASSTVCGGAPHDGSLTARDVSKGNQCNQAIHLEAQQGNVEKAAQLLLEFERSGGQPEAVSYNLVIRACAKRGDAITAEKWLMRMESRGVQATLCSYNTLLDACAKAGRVEACEQWLSRMLDIGIVPNVISYATAIYARARRGDVAAAEAWLRKMIDVGIEPDAVSFNSLIHACGVKGAAKDAERFLHEMEFRRLETGVATYTTVIDSCAKCGDVDRAEAWFSRMVEKGVEPNVVTFSAMIDACAKAGNLSRAEHWHAHMLERGIPPNAHSFSAVINACARQGGPEGAEAAEQWLDRSEQAGVANDVVLYSSVIDACGKKGDAERALRVFRRMKANGLKPHIVAYSALARPFAYRGDWVKVESIAQDLAADGITVNEFFLYAQLLSYAVARPRQSERAELCFRSALSVGVKANDHVVGALARAMGRARCSELMTELCGGREVPDGAARRGGPRINATCGGGASGRVGRM